MNASFTAVMYEKWDAFGWDYKIVNGPTPENIVAAFNDWDKQDDRLKNPLVIIVNTVKGKGVSYMENKPKWHHGVPSEEQLEIAKGTLEVNNEHENPSCHRLRGMVHAKLEVHTDKKLGCREEKCMSIGDQQCEFDMVEMGGNK